MGRTNIVIDDHLLRKVQQLTGTKTKRQAVHVALEKLVNRAEIAASLRKLKGKLSWTGDLGRLRRRR